MRTKAKELELHKAVSNRKGTAPLRPDLCVIRRQKMELGLLAAFNAKLWDAKSWNTIVADDDIVEGQEVDEIGEPNSDMDSHYEQLL